MCRYSALWGRPIATACKCSAFKGTTVSTVMCTSYARVSQEMSHDPIVGHGRMFDGSRPCIIEIEYVLQNDPGFKVWRQNTFLWGKIFIICLKQIFWAQQNLGAQKRFGGNCLRMPHRVCEPGQNRRQKVFHWRPSCLCRGTRHSENLFLIHNMNSIWRLCKLHHIFP